MNKTDALKRLDNLEKEASHLRAIIEAPETPKNIMERVKTFEDACEVLGIDPDEVLPVIIDDSYPDNKAIEAHCKLCIIVRALNQGWKPDWNNRSQYKWYPWFYMGSGFRFSDAYCDFTGTGTTGGSRLCVQSEQLAKYLGTQFTELYNQFLN